MHQCTPLISCTALPAQLTQPSQPAPLAQPAQPAQPAQLTLCIGKLTELFASGTGTGKQCNFVVINVIVIRGAKLGKNSGGVGKVTQDSGQFFKGSTI